MMAAAREVGIARGLLLLRPGGVGGAGGVRANGDGAVTVRLAVAVVGDSEGLRPRRRLGPGRLRWTTRVPLNRRRPVSIALTAAWP